MTFDIFLDGELSMEKKCSPVTEHFIASPSGSQTAPKGRRPGASLGASADSASGCLPAMNHGQLSGETQAEHGLVLAGGLMGRPGRLGRLGRLGQRALRDLGGLTGRLGRLGSLGRLGRLGREAWEAWEA